MTVRSAPPAAARRTPAPGSTGSLRAANQRRVMALLQSGAASAQVSQAEIARTTGLAPATVSNIVRDLVGAGLVETTVGSGRRGTVVRISRRAGLAAGVDIGHQHVRVAIGDVTGELLGYQKRALAPDHCHEDGLRLVRTLVGDLVSQLGCTLDDVAGIGLGLPAPIGTDGVLTSSAILPGWAGVDARAAAQHYLGRPTHVDNDANLGALAEHRRGAGAGHATMIFVKASSGLGSGLIVAGELFHGASGFAGELGHLTVDDGGPVCRCGARGCLEVYASVGHVQAMTADSLPGADIDAIVAAARGGNLAALRAFEDAGMRLGWGLSMVANLLDPSAIVVGGDLSRAGDLLLDWVRVGLRRHALPPVSAQVEVTTAGLGDRASVVGALLLAIERTELIPDSGVG